jgi:MFS transporter, PAT family, beta-lactamase induction signal transducer AmpG
MAALLLLGFSSGLPLLLRARALPIWMEEEKVQLGVIGLFSLAALPYSLKFLWSPLLDRFAPPFLGRRRGWLVIMQALLIVAIAAMALQQPSPATVLPSPDPVQLPPFLASVPLFTWLASLPQQLQSLVQVLLATPALRLLFINAALIAFFGATQDIVADAYRTDVLEKLEMGAGAAVFVLGYRIAMLVSGGLALILVDRTSWSAVFLLMALLMIIGLFASIWAPKPVADNNPPASLKEAVILPFGEFFQRNGFFFGCVILLFIILYNLADASLGSMSGVFLKQVGFTNTDLGTFQGILGLLPTAVGSLMGGAILSKIGINRSLWLFALLQALSNLSYFALAQIGKNYQVLVLTINVENFCGGLAAAGFVAFLMSLCNQRFSATQYALLTSLMAVSRDILVAPAGKIAENTGWPLFFLITIAAAIPAFILLPVVAPWKADTAPMPRPGLDDIDIE